MGNRALLVSEKTNIGVYLHWNGGFDSVSAFTEYCRLRNFRDFDDDYGVARFCQIVGNFFGGSLSIGVVDTSHITEENAGWYDNGIYVIEGWKIKRHIGYEDEEETISEEELLNFLDCIDRCQPEKERLGHGFIYASEVAPDFLMVGDKVYITTMCERVEEVTIVGIKDGVPYTNLYGNTPEDWKNIPSNYIKVPVRLASH